MSFPTEPQDNLSHTVDRLNRVVKATKELNSTLDLSELARIILRIIREEVGIERGTVWVMTPGRVHLKSLAAQEVDQEIQIAVGSGIAGTVARDGGIIDIPDAYQDPRFDQSFDAKLDFRTNDIYCMPVRNPAGVVVGVLQLLNRSRALTKTDEEFLEDISVHVGLAVENATRHLEILEKKRIEQQLELAREIILIKSVRTRRLVEGVLRFRCPICLEGRVFTGLVGTRAHCDDCGYVFARAHHYFVGSAIFTWALTLAIAFGLFSVLNSAVMLPTDPLILAILFFPAIAFVIWFFRTWRVSWLALDLYVKPPRDNDFRPGAKFPSEPGGATPQAPAPQG
jgi:uncharacterized protein (DUF983 family)